MFALAGCGASTVTTGISDAIKKAKIETAIHELRNEAVKMARKNVPGGVYQAFERAPKDVSGSEWRAAITKARPELEAAARSAGK